MTCVFGGNLKSWFTVECVCSHSATITSRDLDRGCPITLVMEETQHGPITEPMSSGAWATMNLSSFKAFRFWTHWWPWHELAYPDQFRQMETSWGASNCLSCWQGPATIKYLIHSTFIALILCSPRNILPLILMTRFIMVMYVRERGG